MKKEPLYIIKVGGNIIDDEVKLNSFLTSFIHVKGKKILVHGGGKIATNLAEELNIPQQMVDGRRITDGETLKVVTMVYAGYINKQIVATLNSLKVRSIGLSGVDAGFVKAHKINHPRIDFGFVGEVDAVDTNFLLSLINLDLTLVIAPITQDESGQLLNTNADTIAQEIAKAMSEKMEITLVYSFEKKGVLKDIHDEESYIPMIDIASFEKMKEEQTIFAGMIPKLDNAFEAIGAGVSKVIIGDASNLQELLDGESGTVIC
jgi:acetylglutamate kinase